MGTEHDYGLVIFVPSTLASRSPPSPRSSSQTRKAPRSPRLPRTPFMPATLTMSVISCMSANALSCSNRPSSRSFSLTFLWPGRASQRQDPCVLDQSLPAGISAQECVLMKERYDSTALALGPSSISRPGFPAETIPVMPYEDA